jgi:hypothetical protein
MQYPSPTHHLPKRDALPEPPAKQVVMRAPDICVALAMRLAVRQFTKVHGESELLFEVQSSTLSRRIARPELVRRSVLRMMVALLY